MDKALVSGWVATTAGNWPAPITYVARTPFRERLLSRAFEQQVYQRMAIMTRYQLPTPRPPRKFMKRLERHWFD